VCYQGRKNHCYTPFKRGYKAASLPPFGKLDHAAIFLLPEYIKDIMGGSIDEGSKVVV